MVAMLLLLISPTAFESKISPPEYAVATVLSHEDEARRLTDSSTAAPPNPLLR